MRVFKRICVFGRGRIYKYTINNLFVSILMYFEKLM